jgi:hypothetical protein
MTLEVYAPHVLPDIQTEAGAALAAYYTAADSAPCNTRATPACRPPKAL